MGFLEESGNVSGEGAMGEEWLELGGVDDVGAGAGEPVAGLSAEEVVAAFGVVEHVVGEDEVAQPQGHGDIEPIGGVFVTGQAGAPVTPPVLAESVDSGLVEALQNGGEDFVGAIE